VMLSGVVILALPAAVARPEDAVGEAAYAWLVASAACYVLGLFLAYRALQVGRVAIVAPIVSTEGALAAVISIALGEAIGLGLAAVLGAIAAGVAMASVERGAGDQGRRDRRSARLALPYALAAAAVFAVGLVATARAAADLPLAWVAIAPRFLGLIVIVAPLVLTGRLRLTRPAAPLVLVAGIGEVAGILCFAAGAQVSIAVTAVLASQFAALSAAAGFVIFRERLARVQVAGIAVVICGVTALSVFRP